MHFGTQQIGKRLEMMTYRCEEFTEEIRRALGGKEELPDDWTTTANVARDTARKVLGVSSKQRKEDQETW